VIADIVSATGLSKSTIYNILYGESKEVSLTTALKIAHQYDYRILIGDDLQFHVIRCNQMFEETLNKISPESAKVWREVMMDPVIIEYYVWMRMALDTLLQKKFNISGVVDLVDVGRD
jgi:hypothetical protein